MTKAERFLSLHAVTSMIVFISITKLEICDFVEFLDLKALIFQKIRALQGIEVPVSDFVGNRTNGLL